MLVRLKRLLRPFYHCLYRLQLRIRCALLDWLEQLYRREPQLPPARLRFRVGESLSAADFLAVGQRAAENIEESCAFLGAPLRAGQTVLDLGCGCGRTLRWLAPRYPGVVWHGCDVDPAAIRWCQHNIGSVRFQVNGRLPPLPYPNNHFDLIYGVSVFTHIDEAAQRAWLEELHRVLTPGGWLLLTYYAEHVWKATAHAAAVARGEFVFLTSAKLKGIVPDWYHTAFQSPGRIQAAWRAKFGEVRYLPRRFGDQDLCAGRKAT